MSRHMDLNSDDKILDESNRARTERLALKLARLKNVAVDIEVETRDHIPMLDNVDNSYERTLSALRSGHTRVLALSKLKGRKLFCYCVLLTLAAFFILYFFLGMR